MADIQTTVRLPPKLAERLGRARTRTRRPQREIIIEALDHWLTHPLRPGCPDADAARRYYDQLEAEQVKAAGP
jgi:predicted transcriptional regulator